MIVRKDNSLIIVLGDGKTHGLSRTFNKTKNICGTTIEDKTVKGIVFGNNEEQLENFESLIEADCSIIFEDDKAIDDFIGILTRLKELDSKKQKAENNTKGELINEWRKQFRD